MLRSSFLGGLLGCSALFVIAASVALGQDPSKIGPAANETVPSWVFYWLCGIGSAGLAIAGRMISVLHERATTGLEAKLAAQEGECRLREAELRKQADLWRALVESERESSRRNERELLTTALKALSDCALAQRENTQAINALIGARS